MTNEEISKLRGCIDDKDGVGPAMAHLMLDRIVALQASQHPKCANCNGTGNATTVLSGMVQCKSCKGKGF